jgi:hypothetical protein
MVLLARVLPVVPGRYTCGTVCTARLPGLGRRGTVRVFFDSILYSRMPTPARFKRADVRPMAFLSGVPFLTGPHCKLRPNTEDSFLFRTGCRVCG